jgi:effector-binding domain-containing protein
VDYKVEVRRLSPATTAVIFASIPFGEMAATLAEIFGEVQHYLHAIGTEPVTNQAFARFVVHQAEERVDVEAGFATSRPVFPAGDVTPGDLPGGDVAVCLHVGPFHEIDKAYAAVNEWLAAHQRKASGVPWELYLSMPGEFPQRTEIYVPLAPVEIDPAFDDGAPPGF